MRRKTSSPAVIARQLGAKRTVARIDNFEYLDPRNRPFFTDRGVDHLIYPEYLAANEIRTALKRTWARQWFEIHNGEIILVGVKLRQGCQLTGQRLRDLSGLIGNAHVSAITRRHSTIIPGGNDTIEDGDIVYFTITPDNVDNLRQLCGKRDSEIKKLMIMGGSRIAVRLADMLADDYRIKIIEYDPAKCRLLPDKCPGCEIINGDARDNDLLIDEGIEDMDAFIALTDSSETNILACLSAKEFGVEKTIAEVENIQFISEAEALNIGTIINKKLLASSRIFHTSRRRRRLIQIPVAGRRRSGRDRGEARSQNHQRAHQRHKASTRNDHRRPRARRTRHARQRHDTHRAGRPGRGVLPERQCPQDRKNV